MKLLLVGIDLRPDVPSLTLPQLAAYLQSRPALARVRTEVRVFSDRQSPIEIAAEVIATRPDLLGLSLYVFSEPLLEQAQARIAAAMPSLPVVVGGPQVQGRAALFLDRHPSIAAVVEGEGERPLAEIVRRLLANRSLRGIAGVHCRADRGAVQATPPGPPLSMATLRQLPSAYLSGRLQPTSRVAYLETTRGCPYRCGFCDFGHQQHRPRQRALSVLGRELRWLHGAGVRSLIFTDPIFNLVPRRASLILDQVRRLGFESLSAQIKAELLDDGLARQLAQCGAMVSVGLQSTSPVAHRLMRRPFDLPGIERGIALLKAHGVPFKLQLVCGLPGDTYASFCAALDEALACGPRAVEAFVLQVLPGTRFFTAAESLGLVFDPAPPHEVIQTATMTQAELLDARLSSMMAFKLHSDPPVRSRVVQAMQRGASPVALYLELARRALLSQALTLDSILQPRRGFSDPELAAIDQLLPEVLSRSAPRSGGRARRSRAQGGGASSEVERPAPSYLGWEITKSCNLRCPHCFSDSDRSTGKFMLSLDDAKRVQRQMADSGIRRLAYSGGEPLLRRDLEAIIEHGRELGILSNSLVSNGTLATEKRLRSLQAAGLDRIQISIDGPDVELHLRIRHCKPRHFELACEAVRHAAAIGLEVDVACFLSRWACHRVEEMRRLATELGASMLRYCAFSPTGRARDPEVSQAIAPTAEDLLSFDLAYERSRQNGDPGVPILLDEPLGPSRSHPCYNCAAGREFAYLMQNGDLYPCSLLIHPPFLVGNINRRPLRALLRSPEMTRISSLKKEHIRGQCCECSNPRCSGGCRGIAYARHGHELAEFTKCLWQINPPE
ncbi:MAG: radical SAM protein [Deltaproteobacteria bacterium]|nr:radical SAM protein [Deltaproteobacteria bacterium]